MGQCFYKPSDSISADRDKNSPLRRIINFVQRIYSHIKQEIVAQVDKNGEMFIAFDDF